MIYAGRPQLNCTTEIGLSPHPGGEAFAQVADPEGNVCHLGESDLRWLLAECEKLKEPPKARLTVAYNRMILARDSCREKCYEAIERIAKAGEPSTEIPVPTWQVEPLIAALKSDGFRVTRQQQRESASVIIKIEWGHLCQPSSANV